MRLYPMNKVADGTARLFEVTSQAIADNKPSTKTDKKQLSKQEEIDRQSSPSKNQDATNLLSTSLALEASILSDPTTKVVSPKVNSRNAAKQDSVFLTGTH